MEFRDALMMTLADLEAAKVPDDLREVAFTLGMKARVEGSPLPPPQSPAGSPEQLVLPARGTAPTADSAGAQLASRLSASYEDVIEVFNFGEQGPELVVGSGKLPVQAAAATKEIAILIAAARQGTAMEEWTPFSEIRAACAQYGRLDSANFAGTMKELESFFSFRSPSPRKREVKLNRPGWERAADLVRHLVAG